MEVIKNPNIHKVEGERTADGIYKTCCPHGVGFEYINGWAMRMVGSCACTACCFNADHNRNKVKSGTISIICLHKPGEEPNKDKLSVFNNVRV